MRMVSTIRWTACTDAFVLERTDASPMERAHRRWGEAELQRAAQLQGGTVGIADLQRRSKYLLKRRRLMEQRTAAEAEAAAAAAPPAVAAAAATGAGARCRALMSRFWKSFSLGMRRHAWHIASTPVASSGNQASE